MAGLFYAGAALSNDNDASESATTITYINGQIAVKLTDQQLKLAAIHSIALETTTLHQKIPAYGRVVDINPLFQHHAKLQALGVQITSAKHQQQLASIAEQRARQLTTEGIYSTYKSQQIHHKLLQHQAELKSLKLQKQNLLSVIRHQWGQVITEDLVNNQELIKHLFDSRHSLLLVTVPVDFAGSRALQTLTIDADTLHQTNLPIEYVSPSPLNTTVNGIGYFYIAHTTLPFNRRINTWLTIDHSGKQGVWIPDNAVVWLNNRPWVYVQLDDNLFQRRLMNSDYRQMQQWFVSNRFKTGERVVVTGPATLLSEEFRSQIPEEDDD